MYKGFFGLLLLSGVLWAYMLYLSRRTAEKPTGRKRVLLTVQTVLCAASAVAGVVLMLCRAEWGAVHAMGLLTLVFSLWRVSVVGAAKGQ
jgi:fatty acid desaturase